MKASLQVTSPSPINPVSSAPQWLLLFAYYFPPLNESGAKRPFRFARYLLDEGYYTQVVTGSPQDENAPWPYAVSTTDQGRPVLKARIGARLAAAIQRVLPYNDQLPWAAHAMVEAEKLVEENRPAAILSTSPPVACHIAALRTKLRSGLPWVADLRDPVFGNPHRIRRWAKPYDAVVEALIVNNADAVIANTDTAAESMRRRYPALAHKIHLIWNGYDPEQPLGPLPLPRREHKVLLHTGSLYGGRHPGALVASLDRLISRGRLDPAQVRLRLVGGIDFNQPWVSQAEFERLREKGCVEHIAPVPEPEAIREMATADYLILLDGNELGSAVQVPAKLFQYIRIGRPILAFTPQNSPSERILAQSGIPYIAAHQGADEQRTDGCVAALFDLPTEPSNANAWFEDQFNAKSQTKALAAILQTVTR